MNYEATGKKVNKDTGKSAREYALKNVSTSTMLWAIVKRHKFALVSTYAIVLTIMYVFPPAPDLIMSLF